MATISSSFIDSEYKYNYLLGWNKKEGKNMENFEKILDRYEQYQIDFINADTETNINLIKQQSNIEKIINKLKKDCINEFKKEYPNEDFENEDIKIDYKLPQKLIKQIEEEEEMRSTHIEILESDINDAKLLLNAAETYEQKIQILKNYNILDDEGRINIYEK